VRSCLRLMAGMLDHTEVNEDVCRAAAGDPALLATDLVDHLVKRGMPFRRAHHAVGALVRFAEKAGKPLNRLTPAELRTVDAAFEADALQVFDLKRALARRNLVGSPGTREVRKQVRRWQKVLGG
jgi:argininosuccinate lyase